MCLCLVLSVCVVPRCQYRRWTQGAFIIPTTIYYYHYCVFLCFLLILFHQLSLYLPVYLLPNDSLSFALYYLVFSFFGFRLKTKSPSLCFQFFFLAASFSERYPFFCFLRKEGETNNSNMPRTRVKSDTHTLPQKLFSFVSFSLNRVISIFVVFTFLLYSLTPSWTVFLFA